MPEAWNDTLVYTGIAENTVGTLDDTLMSLCTWHVWRMVHRPDIKLCHHGIKACIPVWKKWMLSVYNQEVKVYCTLASVPNFLAGRSFNKGYKRDGNHWASWCQPDLWLLVTQLGGCGWEPPPTICHPNLASGDFHIFGPPKKHLVDKWRAADSSVPWYVWVPWCRGETVA
jgi:hypothetical protein